uniref:Uncharacterized protein n=1 Tax=Ixodes ricinus TaxID=34613 RepID=A0A6B0V2Z7_IXORI
MHPLRLSSSCSLCCSRLSHSSSCFCFWLRSRSARFISSRVDSISCFQTLRWLRYAEARLHSKSSSLIVVRRCRIAEKGGRSLGSVFQHAPMRVPNADGHVLGMVSLSSFSTTAQATWNPSMPLKGTSCVSSSQSTTPKDQTSQVSEDGRHWITSGAIQGSVPARDIRVVPPAKRDAPKSQILHVKSEQMTTLLDFKSRCITLIGASSCK